MIESAMSSDWTEKVSLDVSSAANVVRFRSAAVASGASACPVSASTVAPRSCAYSSTRIDSGVVPDSDGMTTIEPGPRWAEPVSTSSAGISRNVGNVDRVCSSRTAGSMRMPAPPDPTKKTFEAPAASRSATNASICSASATAPAWMSRKRCSSKFSMVVLSVGGMRGSVGGGCRSRELAFDGGEGLVERRPRVEGVRAVAEELEGEASVVAVSAERLEVLAERQFAVTPCEMPVRLAVDEVHMADASAEGGEVVVDGVAGSGHRDGVEGGAEVRRGDLVEHPRQRRRVVHEVGLDALQRLEHAVDPERCGVGGDLADRVDGAPPRGIRRLVLEAPPGRQEQQRRLELDAELGRMAERRDARLAQPPRRRGDVDGVDDLLGSEAVHRETAVGDVMTDATSLLDADLRDVQLRRDAPELHALAPELDHVVEEPLERQVLVREVRPDELVEPDAAHL